MNFYQMQEDAFYQSRLVFAMEK